MASRNYLVAGNKVTLRSFWSVFHFSKRFALAYQCAITGLFWLHSYMVQYKECSSYRSSKIKFKRSKKYLLDKLSRKPPTKMLLGNPSVMGTE